MNKVYISGKITGLPEQVFKKKFSNAENDLKSLGYTPVNPAKFGIVPGFQWEDYMRECIKSLCDCNFIYCLPDSEDSRGAMFEQYVATILKILTLKIKKLDGKWK